VQVQGERQGRMIRARVGNCKTGVAIPGSRLRQAPPQQPNVFQPPCTTSHSKPPQQPNNQPASEPPQQQQLEPAISLAVVEEGSGHQGVPHVRLH
jgi:hypothetical protein